jgi:hypothetical protein
VSLDRAARTPMRHAPTSSGSRLRVQPRITAPEGPRLTPNSPRTSVALLRSCSPNLIERLVQLRLRLGNDGSQFAATGEMTAHDSKMYLAWTNSHSRLCDRLGIKSAADRAPSLQDYLTGAASRGRTAPRNADALRHRQHQRPPAGRRMLRIAEALDDPELFGPLFAADTWARWRVFLIVLMCVVRSGEKSRARRWTCSAATRSAASHRQQHFVKRRSSAGGMAESRAYWR